MKTLKFKKRNLLYILLTCVLCVGCDPKYEDADTTVTSINSEGYEITEWSLRDWGNLDTIVMKLREDGEYEYYRLVGKVSGNHKATRTLTIIIIDTLSAGNAR